MLAKLVTSKQAYSAKGRAAITVALHSGLQPRSRFQTFLFRTFTALLFLLLRADGVETNSTRYPDPRESRDLFWKYLASPYPVKTVTFATPASELKIQGRAQEGVLYYRGGLQPGTHFLQHLAELPGQPILPKGHTEVSGLSAAGHAWTMSRGAQKGQGGEITLSASPEAGAGANAATHRATEALIQLRRVIFMGMGYLVPSSISVQGDEFEARFHHEEWPGNTNAHRVHGKVMDWAGNLPAEIRITSPALQRPIRAVVLRYRYDSMDKRRWFPSEILGWYETVGGVEMPALSRKVLEIEFGPPDSPEGFVPRDFMPRTAAIPPITLVASNSTVYWLNGNSLEPVGVASPAPRASRSLFIWVSSVALLMLLAAAWWVRGGALPNHASNA